MMIDRAQLQQDLDETFSALVQLISKFDDEKFNQVPFKGGWTAGMDVQHIILASSGTAEELAGKAKDADRDPEQFVEPLKGIFLDMQKKMKSPPFIDPENKIYNNETLLATIKKIHEDVVKEIALVDLTKICILFEMPGFGHLSRYELVSFVIFHTKRHTIQLENILKELSQ